MKSTISAGEFFDFIRPAVLVLSALVSTWVFAQVRQRYGFWNSLLWALGTLFFPLITLPLYIATSWLGFRAEPKSAHWSKNPGIPLIYGVASLLAIGAYLYIDHRTVDAHLARAAQAKVKGNREMAIAEYHAALSKEDNAHTHKLLAIELADAGDRTTALQEFRRAEAEGETDPSIPYHVGELLYSLNQPAEARLEYQRFLTSRFCTQDLPDVRCKRAMTRISGE